MHIGSWSNRQNASRCVSETVHLRIQKYRTTAVYDLKTRQCFTFGTSLASKSFYVIGNVMNIVTND